jgi:hypothetical protein
LHSLLWLYRLCRTRQFLMDLKFHSKNRMWKLREIEDTLYWRSSIRYMMGAVACPWNTWGDVKYALRPRFYFSRPPCCRALELPRWWKIYYATTTDHSSGIARHLITAVYICTLEPHPQILLKSFEMWFSRSKLNSLMAQTRSQSFDILEHEVLGDLVPSLNVKQEEISLWSKGSPITIT